MVHKSGAGPIEAVLEEFKIGDVIYWHVKRSDQLVLLPKEDYVIVSEVTITPLDITRKITIGPEGETLTLDGRQLATLWIPKYRFKKLPEPNVDLLIVEKLP